MAKLAPDQQTRILIRLDDAQRATSEMLRHIKGENREGMDLDVLKDLEGIVHGLDHLRIRLTRSPMMRGAKS